MDGYMGKTRVQHHSGVTGQSCNNASTKRFKLRLSTYCVYSRIQLGSRATAQSGLAMIVVRLVRIVLSKNPSSDIAENSDEKCDFSKIAFRRSNEESLEVVGGSLAEARIGRPATADWGRTSFSSRQLARLRCGEKAI